MYTDVPSSPGYPPDPSPTPTRARRGLSSRFEETGLTPDPSASHDDPSLLLLQRLAEELTRILDACGIDPDSGETDAPNQVAAGLTRILAALANAGSPRIEILESERVVVVRVELPGLDSRAVEIEATGRVLTLRWRTTAPGGSADARTGVARSRPGRRIRKIPLPEGLEVARAEATMRCGLLEIAIPRSKPGPHVHPLPVKDV